MYIVIAILIFGLLITVHELGHFSAAKLMKVKVNEFAIGMGPAILKKQGKETLYSLRVLPLGGYCAIEGEDGESEDEGSMAKRPLWQRLIILFAGAFMNFLVGFIIVVIILSASDYYATTTINGFMEGFPLEGESGLMVGDRVTAVDGHSVHLFSEFSLYMGRSDGESVDLKLVRDGKQMELKDFPLILRDYTVDGQTVRKYGLTFGVEEMTFGHLLEQGWYNATYFVKMVWMGLGDLVSGRAGLKEMSGAVGVVATINEVGEQSENVQEGLLNVFYLGAFIAVNLAVMNLLPIPGLDGGHIFTMIISSIIALFIGHKPDPKYERVIHGAGLVLLIALMVVITVSDVIKLF